MPPRALIVALLAAVCLVAAGCPLSARAETPVGPIHDQEMPAQPAPAVRQAGPPAGRPGCPDPLTIPRRIARAEQVTLPILMYHHVRELPEGASATLRTLTVSQTVFDAQMAYLTQHGFHTLYFTDLIAYFDFGAALPDNPVIITFDDGWLEQYEIAYPILRKHCLVATFFPPINWVDRSSLTLTWAQIEEMSQGGMEFGSHTINHYLLTNQTAEQITRQLEDSRKALEGHVRLPVVALAYPGGAYNTAVESLVERAGYGAAVAVSAGVTHKTEERFRLHRVTVNYADSAPVFAARLALPSSPPPVAFRRATHLRERIQDLRDP